MKRIILAIGVFLLGSIGLSRAQTSFEPSAVRPVLDLQQHKAFTYFTTVIDPVSKMAYEGTSGGTNRYPLTVGGSGFGVMAIISGVERGWITRDSAALHIRSMVRFLGSAQRFHGVWSHWMSEAGTPYGFGDKQVAAGDLVESAFMMAGLLAAKEYFNTSNAVEKEIRDSVVRFWNTIEWNFYTKGENVLYWVWDSARPLDPDQFVLPINGWNEGLMAYIMALAAPVQHAITQDVYKQGWLNNGNMFHTGRTTYGYPYILGGSDKGGPLFISQYSFLGLDPRKMQDSGTFYWEQQVAHTLINREYCLSEAPASYAYDEQNWGLTACYGVGNRSYLAREPHLDDGVIAPTAAVSAMPYTPYYSLQVLMNLAQKPQMYGQNGLFDAYLPASLDSVKADYLAIDQGPIAVMIENYRSGLIWNLLMKSPEIQAGLALAQINNPASSTGFPLVMKNAQTGVYDMIQHPDRAVYELPYSVQNAGQVLFTLKDTQGQVVRKFFATAVQGSNICSFEKDCNTMINQTYTLEMYADGRISSLPVVLR